MNKHFSSWKKHHNRNNRIKIYQADFHHQGLQAKAQILASAHQEVPMASHHPLQSLFDKFSAIRGQIRKNHPWLQENWCFLFILCKYVFFKYFYFTNLNFVEKNTTYEVVGGLNLGNPLPFGVVRTRRDCQQPNEIHSSQKVHVFSLCPHKELLMKQQWNTLSEKIFPYTLYHLESPNHQKSRNPNPTIPLLLPYFFSPVQIHLHSRSPPFLLASPRPCPCGPWGGTWFS